MDTDAAKGGLTGLVFGSAGLLMVKNIISGEAEIVHRKGAGRAIAAIIGDNGFLILTAGACLIIGAIGIYAFVSGWLEAQAEPPEADEAESSSQEPRRASGKPSSGGSKTSSAKGIRFRCPHCEKTSRVPADYEGRRGLCPKCKAEVTVRAHEA